MEPTTTPPGAPPPPAAGLPWEDRARHGGAGAAFLETVRRLATEPTAAFAQARRAGELVPPLAYAVVVAWIGILVERLWSFVFGTSLLGFLPPEMFAESMAGFALSGIVTGAILVLAPIFVLVGLFVWGAVVHLFLLLYGATRGSDTGFEGTLRALAWASTAQLGNLVPFVGGLVALVWGVVLQTLGLAAFHRTSPARALAAVLTPLALCCLCLALAFFGAIAAVVGAALGGGG
jgi:hypothetical protein